MVSSRSLYSGRDTDRSTSRGYYANDLIKEAWELGGMEEEWPRKVFGVRREPALDLEKQRDFWVTKGSLDVQGRGSSMERVSHVQGH